MKKKRIGFRFWQKAFLCGLLLFLLAFDILGYVVSKQSFSLNVKYMQDEAALAQQVIAKSLYENLRNLSNKQQEINSDTMKSMVEPYAAYYSKQNVYLSLKLNDTEVFSNIPSQSALFDITEDFPEPFENVQLVYKKDISALISWHNDMVKMLIRTGVYVSLCMSAILLFLLLRLTAPFRKLNIAATEIKEGNYSKRVGIKSKDEIGEFAELFNEMADSVQEQSESRERFINNLAHEMRTPITAISGYAEILKIANVDEAEKEKALNYIINQSMRMKNMTYKLMDLAYMNHNAIEKKSLSMEDMKEIITRATATCGKDGVTFPVEVVHEEAMIYGDAVLLESLLQNFLENAVKAGGTEIRIRLDESVITIEDNGRGMDSEEVGKITEPFYRIDKSRARADGGVGLGLALCATICKIHDAKLSITSEIELGTKINIEFTTI